MLHQRVIDRTSSRQQRLELLVGMIFSEDGLALQYDTSATHSVAETFASRRANCLSFTLLLVTLAREAGLQARPQEVGQVLSWYQEQGTVYNFGHVNAQVKVDGRLATVDLDSNILMDRRGPRPISDERLLAHYYNNRGAELMAQDDRKQARAYFQRALALQPELPDIWNNLGVLEIRDGQLEAAARNYATALTLDQQHEATLSNSINLYRRLGDDARVTRLLQRL
ncbi:MAG TPA: UDP-N-acetylglucosamine-peptide N-acetylglucosaminyltransferase, partial [Xanthomonadaceae bacterium]|nr:UDP-N-acetylglucosamine-peptide N-acetylglucosaminyltransferase [Xanthomonadaceae bacterium]